MKRRRYIPLEKGKNYRWYYDRLKSIGHPESYAVLEAHEHSFVWGNSEITTEQSARAEEVSRQTYER